MVSILEIAVFGCVMLKTVYASNLRQASKTFEPLPNVGIPNENESGPCQSDLMEICGLTYPTTYQGIFDARMCLWGKHERISPECLRYLTEESPSIIEPCFDSISSSCKDVTPGDNRIHNCLQNQAKDSMSPQCKTAMDRDILWAASAASEHLSSSSPKKNRRDDDGASSRIGYPMLFEENEIDAKVEEAAEYAYIVKKLQQQQEPTEDLNDKSQLTSKLLDVVAFQDFVSSFSVLPVVQKMHDFLVHIKDELNVLEVFLLQLLSSTEISSSEYSPSVYEAEWTSLYSETDEDTDNDDYYYYENEENSNVYLSEPSEDSEAEIEEENSNGNHIFQELERAASLKADEEDWKIAYKLFSAPEPMLTPLSSESIMSAPKNAVNVMVKTTMAAKNSFLSPISGSSNLRGSQVGGNTFFPQSVSAMINHALQDPRQ